MKPVDSLVMLVLLGVFLASIFGLFDDGDDSAEDSVRQQSRPPLPAGEIPTGPALPAPSRSDPILMIDTGTRMSNSVGTAFSLDSDGIWLTARHVVDGCSRVGLMTGPSRATRVNDIWIHPEADLAVLSQALRRPALTLADRSPVLGETGYGVGYPRGEPGDIAGRLIGRAVSRSTGRLTLDEPILVWSEIARFPGGNDALSGISGGPLLAADGQVLGVIVSATVRRGRFSTGAPDSLPPALNAANLTPDASDQWVHLSESISTTSLPTLGNHLRQEGAVTQVICLVD